jgi:hypothetical protein
MKIYETIIVGSGPSALGYILGMKNGNNSLIISSKSLVGFNSKVHPKLNLGNECIIDPVFGEYGVTHNLGGLSSAWGGILAVLRRNKLLELKGFNNLRKVLKGYKLILTEMSNFFDLYKLDGPNFKKVLNAKQITVTSAETYLISSKFDFGWEKSGINIFEVIESRAKKLSIDLEVDRIHKISYVDGIWEVQGSLTRYKAKRLVLSCGAFGNKELLASLDRKFLFSFEGLIDHVPRKIYAFKLFNFKKLIPLEQLGTPIVNVIRNPEKIISFYRLNKISKNFMDKLGFLGKVLKKLPKYLQCNLYFIQIWDSRTKAQFLDVKKSYNMSYYVDIVKLGFIPFMISSTKAGQGFHYMMPKDTSLKKVLSNYQELTILGGVGNSFDLLENPTLTFMVDSYVKATNSNN